MLFFIAYWILSTGLCVSMAAYSFMEERDVAWWFAIVMALWNACTCVSVLIA